MSRPCITRAWHTCEGCLEKKGCDVTHCLTVREFNITSLTHSHTRTPFDGSGKEAFEYIVEEGEIACSSNSPFPNIFSTLSKTEIIVFGTFNLLSANAFSLVWSKILSCGNGLNKYLTVFTNHSYKPFWSSDGKNKTTSDWLCLTSWFALVNQK